MDDIINKMDELFDSLKESVVYEDYTTLKKKIDNDSVLKEKIDDYKAKHFEYQTKLLHHEPTTFEEEKVVSVLYHSLALNSDAKRFLESEENILAFFRMMFDSMVLILTK